MSPLRGTNRASSGVKVTVESDGDLVGRALAGDVDAFENLVLRHQDVAARSAALVLGGDVEDVVQDTFVKAYRSLPSLRAGDSFRAWIVSIAANEARNCVRSRVRRSAATQKLGVRSSEGDAADLTSVETCREVIDAIRRLGPTQRQVVGYRYLLDLSEAETAQALGVAPGTVKSRLARALHRLRELLENVE